MSDEETPSNVHVLDPRLTRLIAAYAALNELGRKMLTDDAQRLLKEPRLLRVDGNTS